MKKPISLLILLLLAVTSITAQNITFKASAPNSVGANQRFRITYTLQTQSGEQGKDLKVPDVQGLQQLFGPAVGSQFSSSSVNGRTVSEYASTYTYTYLAPEVGTYTVPPASITVGNSTYKSNELTIKVVASDQAIQQGGSQQQSSDTKKATIDSKDVFVVAQPSKREVYENEGFLISFRLYSRTQSMGFTNIQYPNFEGFIAMEIDSPQQQWDVGTYNGTQYYTVLLKQWILYPIKSGKTTIAPAKFEAEIAQRVARERISFFDPIFDTQTVKKTLTTPSITIDATPLPPGKPASFTGAVGDYTMTSSMTPDKLKTDEVVTIKVGISGSGNVKYLKTPVINLPNDFDALDPKTQESIKVTSSGVSGSKSIEYYGIPRYAGSYTIPSVEFSYFDLKTKTYKTLSTPEYSLQVEQGEGGSATQGIISGTNKEEIKYLGQDIRHIKTGKASFQQGDYIWGQISYWLCYIIPALLFIVFFIIYRKQAAQNANIALMRTKKANKVANKRLKLAKKYLAENKREPFYEEISRAVWGYLGDKLNMPAADLTRDNIETNLSSIGVNPELTSSFISILDTAEFARFAPSGAHEAMDELYNSTVNAINQMENRK